MSFADDYAALPAELAAAIRDAGVRATDDHRDVNPPCCYVAPPAVTFDMLHGWHAELTVLAVAPDTGDRDALAELGKLLEALRTAARVTEARPDTFVPSDGGDALPALRCTVTATVRLV